MSPVGAARRATSRTRRDRERVVALAAAGVWIATTAIAGPLDWRFGLEDTWGQLGDLLPPAQSEALAAKLEPATAAQTAGGDVNLNGLAGGWAEMQPNAGAAIDFSKSDAIVRRLARHRFSLLWNLEINAPWASADNADCYRPPPATDCAPDAAHEDALYAYVRAVVERYDGDGYHDMGWETPTDPSDDLQIPVRFYLMTGEIEFAGSNSPDPVDYGDTATAHFWSDSIPHLLATHRIVYRAVHDADPSGATRLVSSGGVLWDLFADFPDYPAIDGSTVAARLAGANNHGAVYTESLGRLVEMLESFADDADGVECDLVGWHPHMGWREIPQTFAFVHRHAPGKPIYVDDMWANLFLMDRPDAPGYAQFTDGGTAIAGDFPNPTYPSYAVLRSWIFFNLFGARDWYEGRTARQLVKSYAMAFVSGAERVGFSGDADFNFDRLVGVTGYLNLLDAFGDVPEDPFHAKPAFWTYQLLVEKAHDFSCVAEVPVSSDPRTRLVRFERPRGPLWIGWSETGAAPPNLDYDVATGEEVSFAGGSSQLLSTRLVDLPGSTEPEESTLATPGGVATLRLGYRPAILEIPGILFADAFECGDLATWSAAVP
ncbi:MAG: hypothetical protein U0X73_04260 [Thermoanaerobaculia bacterium]